MTREARMRSCDRTLARLPALVDGTSSRFGRLRSERHLRSCRTCTEALARQRQLAGGLGELRTLEASAAQPPPEDLLERLLTQANARDLRARAAVPARGAISGARPKLSVAFLAGALIVVGLAGWAGWRLGSSAASARRDRRG